MKQWNGKQHIRLIYRYKNAPSWKIILISGNRDMTIYYINVGYVYLIRQFVN